MIEQIRANRRQIFWGTAGYIVMVAGLAVLFGAAVLQRYGGELAIVFLVIFVLLDVGAVCFATRSGMRLIMRMLKATPVPSGSYQAVWDAVDSIALASGLPVPELMSIDDGSCNAFSLKQGGHRTVFFTTGLVDRLSPDELKAVMGHEMAHLYNEDAALNSFILSLSGFSTLVGRMFWERFRLTREEPFVKEVVSGYIGLFYILIYALLLALLLVPLPLLYFDTDAVLLPGWLSMILVFLSLALINLLLAFLIGAVIRGPINPSREMLADQLCVKWTMHPEALARALTEASCHAVRYRFKALRSALFVPCHFNDPQPSPGERIAYLEDTLHIEIGEEEG